MQPNSWNREFLHITTAGGSGLVCLLYLLAPAGWVKKPLKKLVEKPFLGFYTRVELRWCNLASVRSQVTWPDAVFGFIPPRLENLTRTFNSTSTNWDMHRVFFCQVQFSSQLYSFLLGHSFFYMSRYHLCYSIGSSQHESAQVGMSVQDIMVLVQLK